MQKFVYTENLIVAHLLRGCNVVLTGIVRVTLIVLDEHCYWLIEIR
jgi:hypothetical protein